MKKFTLLLNGRDLDTGRYEYFAYADKVILEYSRVRKVIKELKEGITPKDLDSYIYAQYCIVNEDTNRLAIESAYKAFQVFRNFSLLKRKKMLIDMHKLLLENKEEFIRILAVEGHPRKLAEWEFEGMSVGSSPETLGFYCKQMHGEVGKFGKELIYLARKPDGVIGINSPGNASAASSFNGILAFLVGNSVVIKPPLYTPLSTIFLWKEIVHRALMHNGAPKGVLSIVVGNSKVILNEWLSSNYVNDILHFGDSKTGIEIGNRIFQAGKKPILELSGNDALMVWKDANLDKASESLLDSFMGSTQICMVPKIALIHQDVYDMFLEKILQKVKSLLPSLPSDPDTILSPVLRMRDFFEFLNDALHRGARLIYGGERVNHLNEPVAEGMFITPTLILVNDCSTAMKMRCIKEEIFFPLLPLIKVSGKDADIAEKMIDFVNSNSYGIRASLWISSAKYLRIFAKQLDNCGIFRINSRHIGFSYYLSTHGGTRKSGGPYGEMNYFWQKTSHLQGISRMAST